MMSAIDVTVKLFFERLYLVPGLHEIAPQVHCPYAPTVPIPAVAAASVLYSTTVGGSVAGVVGPL